MLVLGHRTVIGKPSRGTLLNANPTNAKFLLSPFPTRNIIRSFSEPSQKKKKDRTVPLKTSKETAESVSFTKGLFFGHVNNRAFPYPDTLTSDQRETLNMLVTPVNKFMREVDSKKIDETKEIPTEVLSELKQMGLFGLQIPEQHGGLGLSNTAYARICEELVYDSSLAVTVMAHQSIGLKGILLNGNEQQKSKYLPKLASGEHIAAFALTEPSSGSDAGSIKTKATLSPDGKHFLLNGSKIWISNGGWADVMTVFAKTKMPGDDEEKVTAFIVERNFGGVTSGKPEDKLGIRGSNTCEVFFENTPVPMENVLDSVGNGFKVAMNILNNGRFGLGAGSGSILKKLLSWISEHATTRKQFGQTLSSFGIIKEKIGVMALDAYAIESMVYMTTGMIDRGDPSCEVEAAICKVFGSEAAWRGVNESIQVMGGAGFMKSYPYERIMRDTRILSIFEGTNEILRLLIALTGIRGVGDRMKALLRSPLTNPGIIMDEISNRFKLLFLKSEAIKGVHPDLAPIAETYVNLVGKFGTTVFQLLRAHGADIMHQQVQLKRVADITIDLYAIIAVLSRASRALSQASPTSEHEKMLCQTFSNIALSRIRTNLVEIQRGREKSNMDSNIKKIADSIFEQKKYLPSHPVGVETLV